MTLLHCGNLIQQIGALSIRKSRISELQNLVEFGTYTRTRGHMDQRDIGIIEHGLGVLIPLPTPVQGRGGRPSKARLETDDLFQH
jgi:hypothetical protein